MEKKVVLGDYVYKAMKNLEKKDITCAEAFFTAEETIGVAIRNSEIFTQNSLEDAGVGFRVALGNKVGFACTNKLSEEAVKETAQRAYSIAQVSSEVPHFALPGPSKTPRVEGLYTSDIDEVTVEDAIDTAHRAITAAEDVDSRVIAKSGRVLYQSRWRGIINTLGTDVHESETKAFLYLAGAGEHNGEVTGACYEFVYTRTAELEPEKIGESMGKKVVQMFNPQPLKTFQGTVIFGPEAVSYQLTDVLIDALKAESVIAGRSAWTEKMGEKVASDVLTVTDNGILENGFSSRGFDDEGSPSQNTVLLQNGVLRNYLHCATTARALEQENTGNASRFAGGFDMVTNIVGTGYRTKPEIYPSNLVIKPGTKNKEELLSEVEKGVLIESMDGFTQAGSGLISARLSRAFFVENGDIHYPVKGGMVSGIGFDWFHQISGIGSDAKQFDNAVVPSLRVEDVTVVGQ